MDPSTLIPSWQITGVTVGGQKNAGFGSAQQHEKIGN